MCSAPGAAYSLFLSELTSHQGDSRMDGSIDRSID